MPPLELEPMPDPAYPDGWGRGSNDASGTDYEVQELLHKPHAFALMHGDGGAKIAYGQLHWRVDSFTMTFMTDLIEVTVADHPSWSHTHADHVHDNNHAQTGGITSSGVEHYHYGSTAHGDHVHDTVYLPSENLGHGVNLPTITYCSQSSQEAMANMSTTTPKVKTKDGVAMDPQWGNTKYHELDEYGTVYLVWQVDIEQGGSEVIACWVQVGEPEDTSTVGNINSGNTTTNRRNSAGPHDGTGEPEGADENDDKGIFFIELGTVAENDHVTQLVASDVNWTSTVMDRELTTAVNETPTGTYTP